MGTKKANTTAYHPQTDGLVENINRTLVAMIAKHAKTFGRNWDTYLSQLLFAYRTKPHESTGESPFFLLYGRDARLPTDTAFTQPLNTTALLAICSPIPYLSGNLECASRL